VPVGFSLPGGRADLDVPAVGEVNDESFHDSPFAPGWFHAPQRRGASANEANRSWGWRANRRGGLGNRK
jgi:hypothetical protein